MRLLLSALLAALCLSQVSQQIVFKVFFSVMNHPGILYMPSVSHTNPNYQHVTTCDITKQFVCRGRSFQQHTLAAHSAYVHLCNVHLYFCCQLGACLCRGAACCDTYTWQCGAARSGLQNIPWRPPLLQVPLHSESLPLLQVQTPCCPSLTTAIVNGQSSSPSSKWTSLFNSSVAARFVWKSGIL